MSVAHQFPSRHPRQRPVSWAWVPKEETKWQCTIFSAYLCVADTAKAIEFYTKTFGAREKMRLTEPSGRIGHAEIEFGGTTLMLSDEFPEFGITGPKEGCGPSVTLHVHVDDADAMISRAVALGATLERSRRTSSTASARARSGICSAPLEHRPPDRAGRSG